MENKNQYNQSSTEGQIPVTSPKQVTTKTQNDIKIALLEEQLASHQQELARLRRDLTRMKNNISDIIGVLKNRG